MPVDSEQSWKSAIALCDELSAMARVGIPFESGIMGAGIAGSGHYKQISQKLSNELRQGRSLSDALEEQKDQLPGVFHAVVKAGVKSNRLSAALEGVSQFAKQFLAVKRRVLLSILYPAIVVCFTFVMLLWLVFYLSPRISDMYDSFRLNNGNSSQLLQSMYETLPYWGILLPIIVIGGILIAPFLTTGRHIAMIVPAFLSWFPGIRKTAEEYEYSLFSEVFALCLEHDVPLDEAIVLAADASGNQQMADESTSIAVRLRQGETFENFFRPEENSLSSEYTAFTKYMKWMMAVGQKHDLLANNMRQMGAVYLRRAKHRASWLERVIPLVLIVGVAGGMVLLYALMLFLPMLDIFEKISLLG